ncbi:MAG: PAS domain-containing protein, partial [Candidatus Sulfotelmatobacter sp.]
MTATNSNSQLPAGVTADDAGRAGNGISGAYVRRAQSSAAVVVLFTDLEGNVTACDEAALATFDRTSSEVFGRPLAVFV